jgi:hypothetical protein
MTAIYISWAVSALVLVGLAIGLGFVVEPAKGPMGILIDRRGRFSLTHFQVAVWSIVVLSLVSGVFWGRLIDGVDAPLGFSIPDNVLGLIGITLGSSVATSVAKSAKDAMAAGRIAASSPADRPRPAQIFLLEEGQYADKVVDIAKYQSFVVTIVLVVAYVALSISAIDDAGTAAAMKELPDLSGTFLTLLGISHGSYVAGKLPTQAGIPQGLTVANREGVALTALPPGVTARNPPTT